MRKIADKVYVTDIPEPNKPVILEGNTSLIVIDPGCDKIIHGNSYCGSLEKIRMFEHQLGKSLEHVILTHSHSDHTHNVYIYKKLGIRFKLYAHGNNEFEHKIDCPISETIKTEIDGIPLEFINTPGHSQRRDDVTIYLPEQRMMLCGDIAQPQGPEYKYATFVSPVPYFYYGDEYMESLKNVMNYEYDILQTGHGGTFVDYEAKNVLDTTLIVLIRIRDLAERLIRENPEADEETLCEWIFDTVSYERNFLKSHKRKIIHHYDNKTEYEYYDKPGIQYFVRKFLSSEE